MTDKSKPKSILKRKPTEIKTNESFDEEFEKMKMEVKKSIIDLISYSNNIKYYQTIFNDIKGRMKYIDKIFNDKIKIQKIIEDNKNEIIQLYQKIKTNKLEDIITLLNEGIKTKEKIIKENEIVISKIDKDIDKIQKEIQNIIKTNKLDEKLNKRENIEKEFLSINRNIDNISQLKQKIIEKIEKNGFTKEIYKKLEQEIYQSPRNAKKQRKDFLSSIQNEEIEITPSRIRTCNEERICPEGYICNYINLEEGICEKIKELSVDEKISPTKYDEIKHSVKKRMKKVSDRKYTPPYKK